jgi:hypothetical protein
LENFERTHFVVLTGHLDDRPLPELVRTLRAQRKTGRLQIEYPDGPAAFFFEDGQIVDAQFGSLRGLEALYAAVAMRGASFNFNPLVRPPERSIDRQQQQFISDLIEAERREALPEINAEGRAARPTAIPFPARPEPLQLGPVAAELIAPLEDRLAAVEAAITTASRRFSRERLIYAAVISFLGALVIGTLLQVLYNFPAQNQAASVAPPTQSPQPEVAKSGATTAAAPQGDAAQPATVDSSAGKEQTTAAAPNRERVDARQTSGAARRAEAARQSQSPRQAARSVERQAGGDGVPSGHVIQVLMEVRNGRVTSARVLNPRPGAADYESLALRMARQRRYPENFTGAERLQLRVKP